MKLGFKLVKTEELCKCARGVPHIHNGATYLSKSSLTKVVEKRRAKRDNNCKASRKTRTKINKLAQQNGNNNNSFCADDDNSKGKGNDDE
eukprot:m.113242 g.113242  ORF g.113242 m.113242 type:complete len:90 (-) comp9262_c0_seq6:82-351(-)